MIRVFQVKCSEDDSNEIKKQLLKKLNISQKDLFSWCIHRKSVDARKQKVLFSYVIDCEIRNEKKVLKNKDIQIKPDETYHGPQKGIHPLKNRPVVVGFGPAGMFASLILAQEGYCPIVIERGSEIHTRINKVNQFWKTGQLDEECNVQYGEGGAGTFSDGKLTTRSKDSRARKVLEELHRFGAKDDILIDAHPHIGTDAFVDIIVNIRNEIIRLGGSFYFDSKLEDIEVEKNQLKAIQVNKKWIPCQAMILSTGHSASDTIYMLHRNGIQMENKPYAIGVRIEHTQEYINQAMLKEYAKDLRLIPARYQLTYTASNQKGVYTFCMCPGGYVIPCSCQKEQLVINGMSYASRDGVNANSALLVQVNESDYGTSIFAGLRYQEQLEKKAYQMANSYKTLVQLASDYLNNQESNHLEQVQPTYELGYVFANLNELFSEPVNLALHEALQAYEQKVPGFVSSGAILSAVESRSSASVRILRDASLQANVKGIYPCGEGSGYAGGIMTSAIDGIKCAESIVSYYNMEKRGEENGSVL
ncbi:MAG: NAD(P)/FAD-dependent oxidoreductase [Floccifex sp.]